MPSDASGKTPGQAIVRRLGGGGQYPCPESAVANPVPLSKINARFAQAEAPPFRFFRCCRKEAFPRDAFAFRLLHPPLKRTLMKTNFNVNLNLKKISPFRENFSIFIITIEIIYIILFSIPLSARRPYLLRPFGPLRPQPGPPAAGTQPFPSPKSGRQKCFHAPRRPEEKPCPMPSPFALSLPRLF